MAETKAHRSAKRRAAGLGGQTEVRIPGKQRLDALSRGGRRATEVERSGSYGGMYAAAKRLKNSGAPRKVLQVPHNHMKTAYNAMRNAGISGTVKNMGGTKQWSVRRTKR